MANEDEPKVNWGTASLKSGFSGVIRTSEIIKSERSFGDKPPADQLHWVIEPTSYDEPDESRWPQAWYNISDSAKSKWAKLQERLETLKCLPKKGADDLIGLEMEFERIDIEFGKDRDGNVLKSEGVLMPKKLLRAKGGKTTKEASASSPSANQVEEAVNDLGQKKVEPKKTTENTAEKIDLESLILQAADEAPVVMTDFYKKMNNEFHITRTDCFRAMKSLEKQGLVKLDTDSGVLVKTAE